MRSLTGERWVTMYTRIDAHLEHCRAAGFSTETTIPDRRELLTRVAHDLGALRDLTASQITGWLAHPGWSQKTRATYHEHLGAYFRWELAREDGISVNPMTGVPRPHVARRQPRSVPDWTVAVVLEQAVEPYLTAALLARYAGLRACEIARARREDIGAAPGGEIRVKGKGDRVDQIPTSPVIWSHLRGRPPGLLVRPPIAMFYTPRILSTRFAHYCRTRLGVGVQLHDLRRHYGNALRRAGVDLEVVRQLMRHTSLETTQRYLSVGDEERRAGIQALSAHAGPQQKAA